MDEYNAKNYTEQGGEVTHINGTLAIGAHGNVTGMPLAGGLTPGVIKAEEITRDAHYTVEVMINGETGKLYVPEYPFAAHQADSTATSVAALKEDFNALLAKLIEGGLMAPEDKKNGK